MMQLRRNLGAAPRSTSSDRQCRHVVSACLVAEFLEALGLREVTVVGNDTGAIVQLLSVENQARSRGSRWCLATLRHFPPGLTGKALVTAGKLPSALFGASM
jgi:hypothetical protein